MLRVHLVQLCYNLSDPGMEDLLYEAESVRRFVGVRLSEPLPDESTILHFRHLLERYHLGQELFAEINGYLAAQGVRLQEGTIVDATIIAAPTSTKNRSGQRDAEMRQVKKGNQYYFGMKLHIGADAATGVVHSFATTPANVHDVTQAHRLLHGEEARVWGDAGYVGVQKRGREPGAGGGVAGGAVFDTVAEARAAAEAGAGEPGGAGGEGEGVDPGQSGAPLPGREAAVQLRQGTLPWSGQEHGTHSHIARTIQSDEDPTRRGRLIQGAVGAKVRYAADNGCKARGYRPVRRANRPGKHDRQPTEAPDSH